MMRLLSRPLCLALLAALSTLALLTVADAQSPIYHVTDLDPSASVPTAPAAINNAGEIVGFASVSPGHTDPVYWLDGIMTDLYSLVGSGQAFGINNEGDIVGEAEGEAFVIHNGVPQSLGFLPNGNLSAAAAINDIGEIAGDANLPSANPNVYIYHAFLYANGTLTDLGVPSGLYETEASGINDSGVICGQATYSSLTSSVGFLYTNGQYTLLNSLSNASAINQYGAITGETQGGLACVYDNGVLTTSALAAGDVNGDGLAIDSFNDIVGVVELSSNVSHGFVSTNGQLYDLNNNLDSSGTGYIINLAHGINDSGEIVAIATNTSTNKTTGVLLTLDGSPVATSTSPASAPASAQISLTVHGFNFSPLSVVEWNGTPLVTKLISSTKLSATVPAKLNPILPGDNYPGLAAVTVSQLGFANPPISFAVTDPRPVLTAISPPHVIAGGPEMTLSLFGKGFVNGAVADWNGTFLSTTFVSNTKLTATVPAALLATPGTYYVLVINPSTGGGSAGLPLVVAVTSIGLKVGTPSRDPNTQAITMPITLVNTGHEPAPELTISSATLGNAATLSVLPHNLGTLNAGKSITIKLVFPALAGVSGSNVTFSVSGAYSGGSFSAIHTVTLP